MMKNYMYALATSTALLAPGVVYAQAADSPVESTMAAEDQEAKGAEIIVTATKRAERLQDVPVSVAVVTPEVLSDAGVVSTTQLSTLVPGLSFGDLGQPKLTQFVVRGVGTLALTVTLEPSVGVAVDGVPLSRVDGALTDMVDVERVEVLKGPQGMLFGKNATAGLISIVTKKPVFNDNSFIGHMSYGSYDEMNADATVNLSAGDAGAARLTVWRYAHDGFVDASLPKNGSGYYDKHTYGARLGVSVLPTENLQLTMIGQFDGRDENGVMDTDRKFAIAPPGLPGTGANPRLVSYKTSIGIIPSERNYVTDVNFPGYTKGKNMAVTGIADLELGGGYSLSSTTSFRSVTSKSSLDTFNSSAPSLHIEKIDLVDKYTQFSEELRILSDSARRLSFVAGLFFSDFKIRDVTNVGLTGFPFPFSRGGYVTETEDFMTNYAAFGEARFSILPTVRLIAGLRQSHDRTGGDFSRIPDSGPQIATLPSFALLRFTPKTIKYDFTSYRFGGQVDVADDIMVYATTSRGYKAPGFNLTANLTAGDLLTNGAPNNALVDAETVRSHEVGIKSQFLDRRLTINVTGFHSVFRDFQTTVTPPNSPSFVIRNAGELKSSGVEFEISGRPTEGLSLGLNGAYLKARFTDYANANCYLGQPDGGPLPATGVPGPGLCYGRVLGPLGVQGGIQSLNGSVLPLAPKWSLNARARYDTLISGDWRAHIGVDHSYRSKTQFENNDPNMVQDAYGITNFNVGFGPESGQWELSAYVRNAFNVFYVARVREALGVYKNIQTYDALRRVGVQLEVKF